MSETETPQAPAAVNPLDQIVERYIQLRDEVARIEGETKKQVATLKEGMTRIENYLLKHLQNTGSEGARTKAGIFFKVHKTGATVADWDMLLAWIKEHDAWPALEKRVNKTFVEAHMEEHNDLPPGVDWRDEVTVQIRRT